MAAKKDKMIPSEKERKRALKYATPAGTGRMWVTMGIAFIIFGIILSAALCFEIVYIDIKFGEK